MSRMIQRGVPVNENSKTIRQENFGSRHGRLLLVSSFIVTIAMSLLAYWSFRNSQEARQQADIALARQLAYQAQSISATSNAKQMIAVLLATESMNVFPSAEAA